MCYPCNFQSSILEDYIISPGPTTVHNLVPYPRGSATPVLSVLHSDFLTAAIPYALTLFLEVPLFWDTDIFMPTHESSHALDNEIDKLKRKLKILRGFAS